MIVAPYSSRLIAFMTLTVFSAAGCSSLIPSTQRGVATEYNQHCGPEEAKTRPNRPPVHVKPTVRVEPSERVKEQISPVARRIAETIEAVPLLNALLDTETPRSTLNVVIRRLQLMEQIQLAMLEVNSATAEIVCERDRADQLADRIDEVDGRRVKQLTIASIVVGGIAGIVTGGIGVAAGAMVGADAATLGGGVLASWFGVSALFIQSEVDFQHERNILRELWEDPDKPQIFSPILWRYLHRSPTAHDASPRTQVVNGWRQKGRLGERDSQDEAHRRLLFFSAGGHYSAPELRARASMLETLEASLRLIDEELEVLIREMTVKAGWESELRRIEGETDNQGMNP
ncbi:MAG: hypothetical protein NDI90_20370 [Nitrospira sp. BO4]|jgi:hypothetical protein|nr:hypothetical protein [Nitrospira sp. BO4]